MSNANEFLDAIQIMIDKASEKQTKIYNGTVTAIGDNNTCSVTVNGKTHQRISYYGKTPTVNQVYRVFVPQNNMSIAFIITEGADIPPSEATDYNDLLNRPQINNVTLSGNKTAKDLGLYGTSNPPSYPVTSVNNKTGDVKLTASDVGALPNTTVIPTKTSQLENDSGFIDEETAKSVAPVQSVDGATGAVVTNAVKTVAQNLTDAQKIQARANIGAGTSNFSGSFNDLIDKPTIPTKTSDLTNDSGYITANDVPVKSVNSKTGNVVLTQDDVGDGTTYVRTHNDFTDALKEQINTNEDNITMLDSDVDGLQTDVTNLQTNVTNISNALKGKQDSIVGAASTITEDNLTPNRAVISNSSGKIAVSDVTATELGYLDGAKSNIQKQIDDISGSVTSAHYITFTFNSADDTYACDTVFTQIKTWVDAGQEVIGKYVISAQETYYYKLYELGEDSVKFTSITTPFYLDTKNTVIIDGFNIGWDGIDQTVLHFQFSPTRTVYFTDIANKKLSATYDEMYQWLRNGEQVVLWYNWDSDTPTSDTHAGYWLHLIDSDSDLVFGCVRRAVDRGIWTEQISITNANVVTIVSQQLNNIPSPVSKSAAMTQSVGVDSIGGLWTEGSKIDTIQVNGTTQTITNKTVNITVPTSKADIGLGNVDNVKQYSVDNPPPYPVTSVNSKTGAVILSASDVGAVSTDDVTQTLGSSTTKVPSEKAVSDAIGAAGGGDMLKATYDPTDIVATAGGIPDYVANNSPVKSVDGKTGAVTTEAVKYTSQSLTSAQQKQARTNIGAFNSRTDTLDASQVLWGIHKDGNSEYSLEPILAALDPIFAGNKFAFCKPDGITIEYSNDSGSTWSEYTATDNNKVALMTQNLGLAFFIGGKRNAKATVADQLRITIDAVDCGVYTYLTSIILDVSTNGATGCQCKVEYSVNNAVDTFTEYNTYPISGWSGRNSFPWIPAQISNFGNSSTTSTQMRKLRLTFFCTGVNDNYNSNLSVTNIYLIGVQNWKTNSNLAKSGHIYTYNSDQTVNFPFAVNAGGTIRAGAGGNVVVRDSAGTEVVVLTNGGSISAKTNAIIGNSTFTKQFYVTPDGGTTKNIEMYGANGNITAQGTVTANKFIGDGSGLTNLPTQDIPIATSTTVGGVKPMEQVSYMTAPVGIDSNGQLWAPTFSLSVATADELGGVKPVAKTDAMTQDVGIDTSGRLYTTPGGGSSTHVITVTANSSGIYTADTTFAQIETWINNGEQVVLKYTNGSSSNIYLPMVSHISGATVYFEGTSVPTTGMGAIIEQFTIEYDENVNRFEFPVLEENKDYTFTVPTTGWSNNSVTITVSGVQSSYNTKPIIDLNITPGASNVDALNEAYSKIYAVTTGTDKVTVYATEVPSTAISLTMKVIN